MRCQNALDEALNYFREKNLPCHPIRLDVTDRIAYARAADEAEAVFGKIHVLVNNAGIGSMGAVQDLTYQDWDYSMGVNLGGVINGLVTILPRILKHGEGGHIVATSSTNGIAATGVSIVYCTTKFAVAGMMEALATELQDKNIGVSVLVPGPTMTDLGRSSLENRPAHLKNEGETPPPVGDGQSAPPRDPIAWMDPLETGERVLRGSAITTFLSLPILNSRLVLKPGMMPSCRACPDEPHNEKRWQIIKNFGTVIYNDIYDKQRQVGPPDW